MDEALLKKFKTLGAQCVAGSLILDRQVVALLRSDSVIVTPEGEAALSANRHKFEATDVESRPVVTAAPAATPKPTAAPKPPKPTKPPVATPAPTEAPVAPPLKTSEAQTDLDDLLNS